MNLDTTYTLFIRTGEVCSVSLFFIFLVAFWQVKFDSFENQTGQFCSRLEEKNNENLPSFEEEK